MRMWTVWAFTICRRYRLIDFGASYSAHEYAMRIGREDQAHRAVAGFEDRSANPIFQRCDDVRVAGANAGVDLQCSQPEVEQNRRTVLRAQSVSVGPDLGEDRALIQRTHCFRQAQGDARPPAWRRQRSRGAGPHLVGRVDPQPAARGDCRDRAVRALKVYGLAGVADEFGDGAEAADAPGGFGIGELRREPI